MKLFVVILTKYSSAALISGKRCLRSENRGCSCVGVPKTKGWLEVICAIWIGYKVAVVNVKRSTVTVSCLILHIFLWVTVQIFVRVD